MNLNTRFSSNYDASSIKDRILGLQSAKPEGSVVICAYNEEKYLLSCLDSISRLETELPLEIIAINNASQDRTVEILESIGVHVFDEPRKGISFARRKSVEVARGKIIFQTDADTQVPKDWIDLHLSHYHRSNDVVGVHGEAHFDRVHKLFYLQKIGVITIIQLLKFLGRYPSERVVGANMSFIKEVALSVGNYTLGQNYLEDVGLFDKMSSKGIIVNDRGISVITSGRRYSSIDRILKTILDRKKSSGSNGFQSIVDYR
nr:glycosyltransferase family A protein [Candidatus Gracilibacteria bacterium]